MSLTEYIYSGYRFKQVHNLISFTEEVKEESCFVVTFHGSLTLKAPITTAADDIHKYFHCFSEKIRLDISSESSARVEDSLEKSGLIFFER